MDLLDPITVFRVPQTQDSTAELSSAFMEQYIAGHETMVDAIERRDLEAARLAMLKHLEIVRERAQRITEEQKRSENVKPPELQPIE